MNALGCKFKSRRGPRFTEAMEAKAAETPVILEADYRPWKKFKFSLQYIICNKINGAGSNYDGFGRNASVNNSLYALFGLCFEIMFLSGYNLSSGFTS
jgi:hypothetical protein